MAKLFKWLIVLFIPLFSLTLTSCGGDDKDEPEVPKTNFILGEWYSTSVDRWKYDCTLLFNNDGTYYLKCIGTGAYDKKILYEERGNFKYSNGSLNTNGSFYKDGVFERKVEDHYDVIYDEYTSKLIISGSGWLSVFNKGQYSKHN